MNCSAATAGDEGWFSVGGAAVGAVLYGTGAWPLMWRWVDPWFHVKHRSTWLILTGGLAAMTVMLLLHWHTGPGEVFAALVVAPVLAALVAVDLVERRLPDRLTCVAAGISVVSVLYLLALTPGLDGQRCARVLAGAAGLFLFYGGLALTGAGRGMGWGDVKLAPSLAVVPAWIDANAWMVTAFVPFLLGGGWGVVLLLRGGGRSATMPFGPFMVAGWCCAVLMR